DRVLHVALAGMALAGPVADLRRLRHAVADIAEGDAADEAVPPALEDQPGDGAAHLHVLAVAAHAPLPAGARQLVLHPARLPRLEEGAAFAAQRRPFAIVAVARHPEPHPRAPQHRLFAAEEG